MRFFILAILCLIPLYGNLKNTSTLSLHSYTYDAISFTVENTLTVKASSNALFLSRYYRDERFDWNYNTVGLGGVFIYDNLHYSEATYTVGFDSDNTVSHHLYIDITREKAQYLFSFSEKMSFYPSYFNSLFSFSFKPIFRFVSPKLNIYFSADTLKRISPSLWFNLEITPKDFLTFNIGTTTGFDEYRRGDNVLYYFYSFMGGVKLSIKKIKVKYNFEYIIRQSYHDRLHSLSFEFNLPLSKNK